MIKACPNEERPRERCLNGGPAVLSLRECIAILLGTGPKGKGCLGLAREILERTGKFTENGVLEERAFFTTFEGATVPPLKGIKGLGKAGHTRLLAAFELARRYALFREKKRNDLVTTFHFENVIHQALSGISPSSRAQASEWLGFVPVFKAGGIGELCIVEKGARTHINVDLQELFANLLALRPQAMILVHNHPSGDLRPSVSDYELTDEVRVLAKKLGIELIAHLIVATTGDFLIE